MAPANEFESPGSAGNIPYINKDVASRIVWLCNSSMRPEYHELTGSAKQGKAEEVSQPLDYLHYSRPGSLSHWVNRRMRENCLISQGDRTIIYTYMPRRYAPLLVSLITGYVGSSVISTRSINQCQL